MQFSVLDYSVLGGYLLAVFVLAVWLTRRAGASEEGFFAAGRDLPWWLAGVSLIATSFSIDTPMGIAGLVESHGIAGVWFAWCFAIGGAGMLGYALFSELWRRSGVLTDAELVELRYSGRSAAGLRLIKGVYFGVFINAWTLAWILKAVTTLGTRLLGQPPLLVLGFVLIVTLAYCMAAGLWGIAVSDLPQYLLILTAMVGLAVLGLRRVGGVSGLETGLVARFGPEGASKLAFVPGPGNPVFTTFLAYVLILWWAHKNANAAGPVVQRLIACRDERGARRSTLLFTFATFALNYWPMIVVALCALALFPTLAAEEGFVQLFREELPPGLRGLGAAALLAAFMSTVDSHLNLAAAYLVHDVVKRFWRPSATERELVRWARWSTAAVLLLAIWLSTQLESVASAWLLLATLTSGYGLVTLLRWFWWRINAWSEIAALVASTLVTLAVRRWMGPQNFAGELLWVVGLSTPVWVLVTFCTAPTNSQTLEKFVQRVRPWGWWGSHGRGRSGFGRRLALWLSGVVMVLSVNFALGSWIFQRWEALPALAVLALMALLAFRFFDVDGSATPDIVAADAATAARTTED